VPTWLLTTPDAAGSDRATALRSAGVRVEALPLDGAGRPDVRAAVERFAAAGWTAVLVEGGATLAGSFVDADRVDYVTWFVAPLLLGGEGARPAIGGLGAPTPAAGLALEGVRTRRLGPDVLIEGWVRGRRPLV
jgi:diaminohydroxyphosphoribosylaminopyrimidine deaminase/5-amino-6-(5-phosphoribosylamino)uracil reductase